MLTALLRSRSRHFSPPRSRSRLFGFYPFAFGMSFCPYPLKLAHDLVHGSDPTRTRLLSFYKPADLGEPKNLPKLDPRKRDLSPRHRYLVADLSSISNSRPAIPIAIKREVLFEARHHCAVCCNPLPLQQAHALSLGTRSAFIRFRLIALLRQLP